MTLPQRKHIRLELFDYTVGAYFVTICTKDKEHYFGEISNGEMQLTTIGKFLKIQIDATEQIRKGEVEIPCYVIMPNHVHLIVFINQSDARGASLQFGQQSGNLASVIRGIKCAVTRFANENAITFAWQSRFNDHIIRDQNEMNRIVDYIEQNPYNWLTDDYC